MRSEISNLVPLIAFDHLSPYIQKHLSVQKHSIVIKTDKTDKKQIQQIEIDRNR